MRKEFLKNHPVLPDSLKHQLIPLLLGSDPNCVIGIGIRLYLERDDNLDELISELQDLIAANQEYMATVIGSRATNLLSTGHDDL